MSRVRCESCGGEYETISADKVAYFHVCPPVTLVRAALSTGRVEERPLSAWSGITLAADAAAAKELTDQGVAPEAIAIAQRRREAPRADARDERTAAYVGEGADRTRVIRAEGKGTSPVAAVAELAAAADVI